MQDRISHMKATSQNGLGLVLIPGPKKTPRGVWNLPEHRGSCATNPYLELARALAAE